MQSKNPSNGDVIFGNNEVKSHKMQTATYNDKTYLIEPLPDCPSFKIINSLHLNKSNKPLEADNYPRVISNPKNTNYSVADIEKTALYQMTGGAGIKVYLVELEPNLAKWCVALEYQEKEVPLDSFEFLAVKSSLSDVASSMGRHPELQVVKYATDDPSCKKATPQEAIAMLKKYIDNNDDYSKELKDDLYIFIESDKFLTHIDIVILQMTPIKNYPYQVDHARIMFSPNNNNTLTSNASISESTLTSLVIGALNEYILDMRNENRSEFKKQAKNDNFGGNKYFTKEPGNTR